MKNQILILLFVLLFYGCEKTPDGIVDPRSEFLSYRLVSVDMPDTLIYSVDDSVITIVAEIENKNYIGNLTFDIYDDAGELINANNEMKDNGDLDNFHDSTANDSKYSAFVVFSANDESGDYYFRFNATDIDGAVKLLGEKRIAFFNGQPEFPPVISNLVIPDSVERGKSFIFSVKVTDGNGLGDIKFVYFELFRPDGSAVIANQSTQDTRFPLFDNGDINGAGDETAGDGIYSLKNSFGATAQTGYWRFEFRAIDKSDSLSNKITHQLLVK